MTGNILSNQAITGFPGRALLCLVSAAQSEINYKRTKLFSLKNMRPFYPYVLSSSLVLDTAYLF